MMTLHPRGDHAKAKLETKLAEYKLRYDKRLGECIDIATAPEVAKNARHLRVAYKIALVQEVLQQGHVDVETFKEAYESEYGAVHIAAFDSAVTVILRYCNDQQQATPEMDGWTVNN